MAPLSQVLERLHSKHVDQMGAKSGPPDGVLYHYTDASGLIGIIESGVLRATDFRFLNDRSEFLHGIDNAQTLCRELRKITKNQRFRNFASEVEKILAEPDEINRSFIVSLTDRRDDLSQWRGYANEGCGYAIGFKADWFLNNSLPSDAEFMFAKVVYSDDHFRGQAKKIIEAYFETLPVKSSYSVRADVAGWCDTTLENLCALYKHKSFINESEWRLITHLADEGLHAIKVKSKSNGVVPFVEIDLKDDSGKIPLDSIGIGPGITNSASTHAIADLCRQFGYECQIYNADTPYGRA